MISRIAIALAPRARSVVGVADIAEAANRNWRPPAREMGNGGIAASTYFGQGGFLSLCADRHSSLWQSGSHRRSGCLVPDSVLRPYR